MFKYCSKAAEKLRTSLGFYTPKKLIISILLKNAWFSNNYKQLLHILINNTFPKILSVKNTLSTVSTQSTIKPTFTKSNILTIK